MMFKIFAVTDIGNNRKENQDGYFINGNSAENIVYKEYDDVVNSVFAVVCDGVGSSDDGAYAVVKCNGYLKDNKIPEDKAGIISYLNDLNLYINKEAEREKLCTATTIVGFIGTDNLKIIFNIGDSSAFIVNKGFLEKVSVDDTEYAFVFGDSFEVPNVKSPITQFLGGGLLHIEPHIKEIKSNYIILCSDGLTDMVSIDEMEDIIANEKRINDIGNTLITRAKDRGGYDNITIVIIKEC